MGENRFETEKISRLLLAIALPIIVKMLVSELYSLVDTFFVGRYVADRSIASLMVVFPIQRFFIALSVLIGVGTSTMLSRSLGGGHRERSERIIRNGFYLTFLVILPVMLLVLFFPEKVLFLLGAEQETLADANIYLFWVSLGAPFLVFTAYFSYILLCFGDTKVSLLSTSLGAFMNIVLNSVCIFGFQMGVAGAGIGSFLSQVTACFFLAYKFRRRRKETKISLQPMLSGKMSKWILLGGFSGFLIEVEDSIVIAALNRILLSVIGSQGITILGLVIKVYMFIFIALFGIVSAMQPIAAYYYGGGKTEKLQELIDKTMLYGVSTTLLIWLVFQIFPEQLVGIFVHDPVLIRQAASALRMVVATFPVLVIYYIGIFYFQARGDATLSLIGSLLRQIVLLVPITLILTKVFHLGDTGVWLAYPITDVISALIMTHILKKETKLDWAPTSWMPDPLS